MTNTNHHSEFHEEDAPSGALPRRDFVKYLLAGSALSIAAIDKLNAGIYQSITTLNQKYVEDISPDGAYWTKCARCSSSKTS